MTDPRCPSAGVRCYLPAGGIEFAMAEFRAEPGALADFDQTRICLGLPDGCRDIEPEKSTLLEHGFDRVGGISWTKGCYVGQEVTARMKYRNLGKKRLFVVDLEAIGAVERYCRYLGWETCRGIENKRAGHWFGYATSRRD